MRTLGDIIEEVLWETLPDPDEDVVSSIRDQIVDAAQEEGLFDNADSGDGWSEDD